MYRTTRIQHTHFCMLTRTAPMRSKTCLLVRITAVAEILGLGYGGPKGLGVFFWVIVLKLIFFLRAV